MTDLNQELYQVLKNKANKKNWSYTTDDGVKYNLNGDEKSTILERRIRVTQLSNFRSFNEKRNIRFFNLEDATDEQVDDFMECLKDHDYERFDPRGETIRVPFFKNRDYEADNMIKIEESADGKKMNGIILGMYNNKDFKDVYNNGVQFEFPNCLAFSQKYGNDITPPDWNDYEVLYAAAKNEIKEFVTLVFSKIKNGASDIPACVYPIVNNRLYFLTGQEYTSLEFRQTLRKRFKHFSFQPVGVLQRLQHLLTDWRCVEGTLNIINSNPSLLAEKPYIDLTNEIELGMSTEEFLVGLLTEDERVAAHVQEVLHQKEEAKETGSGPKM